MNTDIINAAIELRLSLTLEDYCDIKIRDGCPASFKEFVKLYKGYGRWFVYSSLTNMYEKNVPTLNYPQLNETQLMRWFKEDSKRINYINTYLKQRPYPVTSYLSFASIMANGMFIEYAEVFDKVKEFVTNYAKEQKEKKIEKPKSEPVTIKKAKIDPLFDLIFNNQPVYYTTTNWSA